MGEISSRPRRPPPPAPMPRLRPPLAGGARRPPAPRLPPVDPLVEACRIPDWRPLPMPRLVQDAPPDDAFSPFPVRQPIISREHSWSGMMSWCWGLAMIMLVVSPLVGIPKLTGAVTQPISGASYGALIAPFGFIAVAVAMGAGLYLWAAMGREHMPDDDLPGGPE